MEEIDLSDNQLAEESYKICHDLLSEFTMKGNPALLLRAKEINEKTLDIMHEIDDPIKNELKNILIIIYKNIYESNFKNRDEKKQKFSSEIISKPTSDSRVEYQEVLKQLRVANDQLEGLTKVARETNSNTMSIPTMSKDVKKIKSDVEDLCSSVNNMVKGFEKQLEETDFNKKEFEELIKRASSASQDTQTTIMKNLAELIDNRELRNKLREKADESDREKVERCLGQLAIWSVGKISEGALLAVTLPTLMGIISGFATISPNVAGVAAKELIVPTYLIFKNYFK
jgi:hypothetical protein